MNGYDDLQHSARDNQNDHKAILDKMSQQDNRLGEVLSECRSIRQDMRDSVLQGRQEAKEDREKFRKEVGDLHSRINEVKSIAEQTQVKLNSTTEELSKVRANLGKVTLGLVSSIITAVIAAILMGQS